MGEAIVAEGFTEEERPRVATLYWEAFGRKLGAGFIDAATGRRVIEGALRDTNMLIAREHGAVVGVCGFHADGTGSADLGWSRLRRSLSVPAALRASLVLSLLSHSERPGALVLDGICVDQAVRGRGIGSSLLSAAADKARRMGARTVNLSVIDRNRRARALYERQGFTPVGRGALGLLSPVYGFDGYTAMELEVGR
ncbi:GNAT family N-acetyltransferase [Microbacterium sp. NPDC055312]